MPTFSVNVNRFDPYKTYRFLVYFGNATKAVAGVSKVGGLTRTSEPIDYKQGGDTIIRRGLGRTKYNDITLERGLTHDPELAIWANAAQVLDKGAASVSLKDLRRQVRIDLHNEAGQPVYRYILHRCWVSEYQALPDLDAGANAIALEHIKLAHEGWEQDLSLAEPAEI